MAGAHDSTQGRILLGCYKADWNSDISGEHDRFWIFTPQPEINLLAAAHDSGCCNTGHLGLADFTAAVHGMQILLNAWRLNWEVMFLLCLLGNQCLIWGLQVLFSVAEIGFIEGPWEVYLRVVGRHVQEDDEEAAEFLDTEKYRMKISMWRWRMKKCMKTIKREDGTLRIFISHTTDTSGTTSHTPMPIHRHIRPQILERLNWQLGIKNLAPPEKLKTKPSIWRIHRRWSSREWKWKKTQFASRSWRPISPTLNATVGCYSTGNFRAATNFARLDFQTDPSIESQITIAISKQILQASEKKNDVYRVMIIEILL